jgi:hypothetical protein
MRKARLQGALLPCRFGTILVGPGYRGLHGRSGHPFGRVPQLLMRALVIALALSASIGAGGVGGGAVYALTAPPAVGIGTTPNR